MAPDRNEHSRRRLARILGLPEDASSDRLRQAGGRLLAVLRRRRANGPDSTQAPASSESATDRTSDASVSARSAGETEALASEGRGLEDEIDALEADLRRWDRDRPAAARSETAASRADRRGLAGVVLGAGLMLGLLIAYASGFRVVRIEEAGFSSSFGDPAVLMLIGPLPGATLRVLDADREELFVKTQAEGAIVELPPRRYAIEVSREDCPDAWTRSVYFEAGATHRFEPRLCVGEGQLTLRSNVPVDRLRIDGYDVDAKELEAQSLSVGDHQIRLDKAGYAPYEATIRIRPDEGLELSANLEAESKSGRKRRGELPMPVAPPVMKTQDIPKPEPFDLGGLQDEIRPRSTPGAPTRLLRRKGMEDLPDGGSTAWHDRVSRELLTRFDADGSGQIDQLGESEAISCALWREIETDFERGGLGLSMARYFGFDGSEWHPNALGFARKLRSAAYAKMKECGLQK